MSHTASHHDRRTRTLLRAARGIAAQLDGWSFREPDRDWGGWVAILEGPDGQGLRLLWAPGRKRGQVEGVFPKLPCGNPAYIRHENQKRCRIGVDFTRPPADLARDITRRLLPAYEEVFEEVRLRTEEAQARHEGAEGLLSELTGISPNRPQTDAQRRRHEVTFRDLPGSARVTGPTESRPEGSVHLRLELPGPVAVEVLRLVAEQASEPALVP